MTGKDLFREIGMVDEKYVEEAREVKTAKILTPMFRKTLATAACLCVCVGLYFGVLSLNGGKKANESADMMILPNAGAAGIKTEDAMMDAETESSPNAFWDGLTDGGLLGETQNSAKGDSAGAEMESSESTNSVAPSEDSTDMMLGDSQVEFNSIQKRLEQYPADYEAICETDAFVVVHGSVEAGLDKWEAFLEAAGDGKPASVDIVQFTIEGDPIITCLFSDGTSYFVVTDSTRDKWGDGNVWQEEYECLKVSEKQDGSVEVILGDVVEYKPETGAPELTNIYHLVIFKAEE